MYVPVENIYKNTCFHITFLLNYIYLSFNTQYYRPSSTDNQLSFRVATHSEIRNRCHLEVRYTVFRLFHPNKHQKSVSFNKSIKKIRKNYILS